MLYARGSGFLTHGFVERSLSIGKMALDLPLPLHPSIQTSKTPYAFERVLTGSRISFRRK